ncbi:LacI family DNA-binding transcriptional regulator [Paracoccus aminophilus]|uniref:Transcriptional regulator, LacI family n=1 Tax=Paracoccus aminophilus JCM 7686 TaxID=1367847 RepID=S5XTG7_PARAH|nr:LacI family DNA-binding transcriptional regulator [Paracoccus aminophilus]AGT10804.1 transcriptional regulator, LacI family [Paracoccus aminophilus JCM 7686]
MANLKQVAERAGVSSATVSRYLNGSLSLPEATRSAVDAAIADLNYRPNPFARSLSRGRTDLIRMVVPEIKAPFFAALVAAVENEAFLREQELALSVTLNRPGRESRYLDSVSDRHVDGLIFVTNHPDVAPLTGRITAARRVVLLDEDVPGAIAPRLFCDNDGGGYLAGAHLAAHGHACVAVIGAGDEMHSGAERFRGFSRAMTEAFGADVQITRKSGSYSREDGERHCREILAEGLPVTAIFAMSDELVIGALDALMAAGLSVPADVSLIGFDDILPLDHFATPITAIRQPVEALGVRAVSILLDTDWEDPAARRRVEILPVTLVDRSSVASVASLQTATDPQEEHR